MTLSACITYLIERTMYKDELYVFSFDVDQAGLGLWSNILK